MEDNAEMELSLSARRLRNASPDVANITNESWLWHFCCLIIDAMLFSRNDFPVPACPRKTIIQFGEINVGG